MPFVSRTRARPCAAPSSASSGSRCKTRVQTPLFCGHFCKAGEAVPYFGALRPLRTNWLNVGTISCSCLVLSRRPPRPLRFPSARQLLRAVAAHTQNPCRLCLSVWFSRLRHNDPREEVFRRQRPSVASTRWGRNAAPILLCSPQRETMPAEAKPPYSVMRSPESNPERKSERPNKPSSSILNFGGECQPPVAPNFRNSAERRAKNPVEILPFSVFSHTRRGPVLPQLPTLPRGRTPRRPTTSPATSRSSTQCS